MTEQLFIDRVQDRMSVYYKNLQFFQEGNTKNKLVRKDENLADFILYGLGLETGFYKGRIISSGRNLMIVDEVWKDMVQIFEPKPKSYPQTVYTSIPVPNSLSYDKIFSIGKKSGSNEEIVKTATEFLIKQYKNLYFPYIEQYSNIINLDVLFNEPIHRKTVGGHWVRKFIVAKLADNPQYDEIYEFVLKFFQEVVETAETKEVAMKYGEWVEGIKEIHNRLKKIKPLENPYLGSPILRDKIMGNSDV